MNFATIQPKLSQYCFIAVRNAPGKGGPIGSSTPATYCCNGISVDHRAFFLFSVIGAQADGSFGTCEDATELAVLPPPIAPWKGAPLRVVFAAENPLEGEFH